MLMVVVLWLSIGYGIGISRYHLSSVYMYHNVRIGSNDVVK